MPSKYLLTRLIDISNVLPYDGTPRFYFLCDNCSKSTSIYKHIRLEEEPTEVETFDTIPISVCTPRQSSQGRCCIPCCQKQPKYWFYFKRNV